MTEESRSLCLGIKQAAALLADAVEHVGVGSLPLLAYVTVLHTVWTVLLILWYSLTIPLGG
jgi:p-aminobenzoyl-glutamate transporter AbgT